MPAMTGPGADPIRRRRSISTAPTAGPSARLLISSSFKGVVQVDGYPGFERLTDRGDIELAACWAHARRKFYEVHQATGSPIAAEALRRIAELYAIEAAIRGQTAEAAAGPSAAHRSLPLVEAMKTWLEAELHRIPPRGASGRGHPLRARPAGPPCAASSTTAASNSTTTRSSAPSAPSRSAARTICSPDPTAAPTRWAVVASLLATAKLNDVEPFAYLKDVLERMSNGHPMSRLDDLLPWNWKPARPPQPDHVSGMDAYGRAATFESRGLRR